MAEQLTLDAVSKAYENVSVLTNDELYQSLIDAGVISEKDLEKRISIGEAKAKISPVKRRIRWIQQDLKQRGIIKRASDRGVWSRSVSTDDVDDNLSVAPKDLCVIGFSTNLGMAVWGDSRQFLNQLDVNTPIQLCLTSPPFPLQKARNYGNPKGVRAYIEFLLSVLEPIAKRLVKGGSLVLNISNDIFKQGSPARSTYLERLIIAIEDELDLQLMDRIVWHNKNKPPGPTKWACSRDTPFHMKSGYEPVLHFSNDPLSTKANNRNILLPNSKETMKLIVDGGEKRIAKYGDGAYSLRSGSFANETAGTLQSNVLEISSTCKDTRLIHQISKALNLPVHGAMFPTNLSSTLIRWLTQENDIVIDPFAGSARVALSAELLKRQWICIDKIAEFVQLQRALFASKGLI